MKKQKVNELLEKMIKGEKSSIIGYKKLKNLTKDKQEKWVTNNILRDKREYIRVLKKFK